MPAISFSNASKVVPAPSWRFYVEFPTLAEALGVNNTFLQDGSLSLQVMSFGLQHKTIEHEEVFYNSGHRFFPTGTQIAPLAVTFLENEAFTVAQFYTAWRNLVIFENGNFGLPKDFCKPLTFTPLTSQNKEVLPRLYEDCFPISLEGEQFDGASTNFITSTITFLSNNPRGLQPNGVNAGIPAALF